MATTVEKSTAVNQEYLAEKYAEEPHVLENFFVDPKIEHCLLRKVHTLLFFTMSKVLSVYLPIQIASYLSMTQMVAYWLVICDCGSQSLFNSC